VDESRKSRIAGQRRIGLLILSTVAVGIALLSMLRPELLMGQPSFCCRGLSMAAAAEQIKWRGAQIGSSRGPNQSVSNGEQ
jgi:hypothetical protein